MHSMDRLMACSVVCIRMPSAPLSSALRSNISTLVSDVTVTPLCNVPARLCTEGRRSFERHCVTITSLPGIGWSIYDWVFNAGNAEHCSLQQDCTTLGRIPSRDLSASSDSPKNVQFCAVAAFVNLHASATTGPTTHRRCGLFGHLFEESKLAYHSLSAACISRFQINLSAIPGVEGAV